MSREAATTQQAAVTREAAMSQEPALPREAATVRVALPFHLRTLARVDGEIRLAVARPVTQRTVLDALETRYPPLRGTLRDHATGRRRKLVRFFACGEDLSNESPDTPLPDAVASGAEPYLIVGAIAGG